MPSRGFSRGRGRLEPDRCSRDLSDMTARTSPSLSLSSAPAELDRWRRETPGCRERIHLNNAGAALMPQPVLQALTGFLEREAAIGGYEAADEAEPRVRETYELLGRLVGAAARNVAIVENATVAFSQAVSAFDFRPGDRIITTRADYPSNQLTYLSLARRPPAHAPRRSELGADQLGIGAGRGRGGRCVYRARGAVSDRRLSGGGTAGGRRCRAALRFPGRHRTQILARPAWHRLPLCIRPDARARRVPLVPRHAGRGLDRPRRLPARRRR